MKAFEEEDRRKYLEFLQNIITRLNGYLNLKYKLDIKNLT